MRYFFNFMVGTHEYLVQVKPDQARDIDHNTRVVLSTFFPETFPAGFRAHYVVLEKILEAEKLTITFRREYNNEKSIDTRVQKPSNEGVDEVAGKEKVLPKG